MQILNTVFLTNVFLTNVFLKSVVLSVWVFYGSSLALANESSVDVLFHPIDDTLGRIAERLGEASENIDLAMYNLDVSDSSPVMQKLASEPMQAKIRRGDLCVRMIFEGYGSPDDIAARSQALEARGVDVRWLKGGKKVHHKFAVIDSATDHSQVISGSANWSLSSRKNYDENILFWTGYPSVAASFQNEFNLLWSLSESFGEDRCFAPYPLVQPAPEPASAFSAVFNTSNYKVTSQGLRRDRQNEGWILTRSIVDAIDAAEDEIAIATTRIVLRPIYEALLKAASRGVKIEIVVNQDEYASEFIRERWSLNVCDEVYEERCSASQAFPWFLDQKDFEGSDQMQVRIKFFSLNLETTLAKQMHSKYLIVDRKTVLTGSFNWSVSAEWEHIENIVSISSDSESKLVVKKFVDNHKAVFTQGRQSYSDVVERFEAAARDGTQVSCNFVPMALTFEEIDHLMASPKRYGSTFQRICDR